MAASAATAGLGFDAISQIFKFGTGMFQNLYGTYKLGKLKRPTLTVDPAYKYNEQLAGQIASQGIPDSAKNFYGDAIERGLGTSINAALSSGQGLNAVNNSFQTSTDAFKQLLMADAMQKQRNQEVLMGAKKELAQQNLMAWDYNTNIPYQLDYTRYVNMINSGQQNMYGAQKGMGADAAALGNEFGGYGNKNMGYDWNSFQNYGSGYGLDGNSYSYNNYG